MSTSDVARDLDLLRQAVGDEKLNFVGYSYGSYLGVTYANLFPENVGAMVIDGVIDPIAWSTGRAWSSDFFPFTTRIRSAEGAQDTLTEFLRLCEEGGIETCPLAGGAESRLSAVLQAVQDEPVVFVDEMGEEIVVDYTLLIAYIHGELYSPDLWPQLALTLATIDEYYSTGEITAAGSALLRQLGLDFQQPETMLDQPMDIGFYGVSCSDSDNPYYYDNWTWAAEVSESLYQYFGSYWTWRSSACHAWPTTKESRYTDGFRVKTENPVLVVNNLYDPATPYHGAEIVNKLLRNSRLLTVNGWGHPSMHLSACAGRYVADYLLTGSLPEKGARCDTDFIPFSASLDVSGSAMQRPFSDAQNSHVDQKDVHSELIKEILPHRFH
jgi:pimeloyl-ACP methyl ester carboxylesterase